MIKRSLVQFPKGVAGEFCSPRTRSTFCADSYFGIRSTPVLPQKHIKDPSHSAKSAGGRLQLNTHTPTQECFSFLTLAFSSSSICRLLFQVFVKSVICLSEVTRSSNLMVVCRSGNSKNNSGRLQKYRGTLL